jgi:transcriptional regulator with XRE-family HTH domain
MTELYKKFGELLKLERKRKGVKHEELSEQLKISSTNLEYLEEGEVSSLPSMIYYNLFAKAYAEVLGIDYERTIEAIKEDLGEVFEQDETEAAAPADGKKAKKKVEKSKEDSETSESAIPIKKMLYLFGGIVIVFAAFLLIYLVFFSSDDVKTDVKPHPEKSTEIDAKPDESDAGESEAAFDWNVPDYQEPQQMKLRLIPRNQSWSTVLADGDTAIFRNLIPGRVYDVAAMYRLTVSVGIPSQVDIELNSKPVDLRNAETGRISRVNINQLNLAGFLEDKTETEAAVTSTGNAAPSPQDTSGQASGNTGPEIETPVDTSQDKSPGGDSNDEL